jgi:ParB family chromosome partitioning protein
MTDNHQSIPLNQLVLWPGNVRKTAGADTALAELAASIAAHGLLQSLVVRKDRRGKYAVIAGGRRLAALRSLADSGTMAQDAHVPCLVVGKDADGVELGLAENTAREAMHPADEFEAFRQLADKGLPVADIAARFGVTEDVVERRLRLARVSPVIVSAYRAGEISLEGVMAFAVTDDHAAQEKLWHELPDFHRTPRLIRATLVADDLAASDRRVRFVGLQTYEEAGGSSRRDLFSDDEDGVFVLDRALLARLADTKLAKTAKTVRKEGWNWVEVQPPFGEIETYAFGRQYAEPVPLSADEAAELARVEQEIDALYDVEGDLTDEQQARFEALCHRFDELTDNRETFWPDATLAIAGALVRIGRDGEAEILRGLVRPEDQPEPGDIETSTPSDDHPRSGLSAGLIESLTAERSAALAAELMQAPAAALATLTHALALPVFYSQCSALSCLQISLRPLIYTAEGSKPMDAIEAARLVWAECLPGDAEALWNWCMEQRSDALLELLAFCAAASIDAVLKKGARLGDGRLAHADALAKALGLDMTVWFQPTARNYFSRIGKPLILQALQEAKGVPPAPQWFRLKKAELAALAERETAGTSWLPTPLRSSSDGQIGLLPPAR